MGVNLYHVRVGPLEWRYTSGEFDVVTATETWEAIPIKRSDLDLDLKKTNFTFTLPSHIKPFDSWKYNITAIPILITLYDYPSMAIKFEGRVSQISYDIKKGTAKVGLGSTDTISNTTTPSRTFGARCSFELFDNDCTLNRGSFSQAVALSDVTFIDQSTLRANVFANHPNGAFRSGYVLLNTGESQFVVNHTGDTIKLLSGFGTIDVADSLVAYYGCNKTKEDCAGKFNNLPNFGGFPTIPDANPVTEGF
jgi:uncharacterized phage protein (TIGR02218 family)